MIEEIDQTMENQDASTSKYIATGMHQLKYRAYLW